MVSSNLQEAPRTQTQSKLLSLPAEIRTQIYELALAVPPAVQGRVVISNPFSRPEQLAVALLGLGVSTTQHAQAALGPSPSRNMSPCP